MVPSASANGAAPSIAPLQEVPRIILTPSTSVNLLYAVIASWALHLESSTTSSNILPLMPPAALISSTANCLAWLETVPYVSPGPVSDSMTPIRNVSPSPSSPLHAMNPNAATNSAVSRRNDLTENVFILASSSHVACAHPGCRGSSTVPPSCAHSMPLSTILFNKLPQCDCEEAETRTGCMFSCVLCCLALCEMVQSYLSLMPILRASTSHTQFVVGR